jgi:hypothetical protein
VQAAAKGDICVHVASFWPRKTCLLPEPGTMQRRGSRRTTTPSGAAGAAAERSGRRRRTLTAPPTTLTAPRARALTTRPTNIRLWR